METQRACAVIAVLVMCAWGAHAVTCADIPADFCPPPQTCCSAPEDPTNIFCCVQGPAARPTTPTINVVNASLQITVPAPTSDVHFLREERAWASVQGILDALAALDAAKATRTELGAESANRAALSATVAGLTSTLAAVSTSTATRINTVEGQLEPIRTSISTGLASAATDLIPVRSSVAATRALVDSLSASLNDLTTRVSANKVSLDDTRAQVTVLKSSVDLLAASKADRAELLKREDISSMGFALESNTRSSLSALSSTVQVNISTLDSRGKATYLPIVDAAALYANISFMRSYVSDQLQKMNDCYFRGSFYFPATDSCSITTCSEAKTDGTYLLTAGGLSFRGYCQAGTDNKMYLVIQRRVSNGVDFWRTYAEYENGFGETNGDLRGNLWLGLKNIQAFTNAKNTYIRFELKDMAGATCFAQYSAFKLNAAADKYRLNVAGFSGTCGDSFLGHNGYQFSAKDSDNDVCGCNCASDFKGAWWYSACHSSNLNGIFYYGSHATYADGVDWYSFRGHYYSVYSTMLVGTY